MDKEGFKFLNHFPQEIITGKNDTEMKLKLKNGSIFQVVGTDKIDSIMGTNPIGCVFSEYSLQNPKAWEYIRPILAENGGWAVFNFTPRGRNHGWKILQQAKDSPDWFWQILTVDDTRAIDLSAIEEEKRTMPQDLFEQEYYCKFLDGAGQYFKRIRENIYHGDIQPEIGHSYQLGVDLAKYQDFTVLTPFNLNTFYVGRQERFNQTDWAFQKARIEAVDRRFNNAGIIADSTGIGDPIVEDLERMGLSVEPYKFTETTRRQLLENLQIKLAQDQIKIPDDEGLIEELESMQYTLTETGKIKVAVPESLHDDRIMSLALAVWNATLPIGTSQVKEEFNIYTEKYG